MYTNIPVGTDTHERKTVMKEFLNNDTAESNLKW